MKHIYCAQYDFLRLRPVHKKDIELLRQWRNNKDVSAFLRPLNEITPEMQLKWYENYLVDNDIYTFVIEDIKNIHQVVGSVAIYRFRGDSAEVGKIVVGNPIARGKRVGYYALVMAMKIGHEKLGVNNFTLNCFEKNISALKNYQRAGFVETGRHMFIKGGYEIEMCLSKEKLKANNKFIKDIVLYSE